MVVPGLRSLSGPSITALSDGASQQVFARLVRKAGGYTAYNMKRRMGGWNGLSPATLRPSSPAPLPTMPLVSSLAQVYSVSSQWQSIPHFEAYSASPESASRTPLPSGVMQYVPKKGEGFPEDYLPFKDLAEAVNAKY